MDDVNSILESVRKRDPYQNEFLQALDEVISSLKVVFERDPKYILVLERLLEPERVVVFRVPWVDDNGRMRVNRGFRVQFNSAIGPYKGGLRFHPSVNLSILKFLAFEQTLKNSLTGLPLGGGKGGSDFDPKGKSDTEVMRFCQSFMTELYRHIGSNIDVPAGDIGVAGREIGYLFGQFKRITSSFEGVLTGKGYSFCGSLIRPEATGYGTVYFAQNVLEDQGSSLKGKKCIISGSGNVAQYAALKLIELGALVLTLSDSNGFVHEKSGFTVAQVQHIMWLKNEKRGRIKEYLEHSTTAQYFEGEKPWKHIACDYAFPCATQNEILEGDAKALVANSCKGVFEGANMPSDNSAIKIYRENGLVFGPAKAANAGGVAVSGLEMSQNSLRLQWTREEVDSKLQSIMKDIQVNSKAAAEAYGHPGDYQLGANIAAFLKVAEAMEAEGCV